MKCTHINDIFRAPEIPGFVQAANCSDVSIPEAIRITSEAFNIPADSLWAEPFSPVTGQKMIAVYALDIYAGSILTQVREIMDKLNALIMSDTDMLGLEKE